MNGLDLEPFLRLVRADLGVWITLVAILGLIAVMTWTSWGSRRALRKCLVLSIIAHGGLLLYGYRGGLNAREVNSQPAGDDRPEQIRDIRVSPVADVPGEKSSKEGIPGRKLAAWDLPRGTPAESENQSLLPDRPAAAKERVARIPVETLAPPPARPPEIAQPDSPRPEVAEAPRMDVAEAAPARSEELPAVDLPPPPPVEPIGDVVRIRPRRNPASDPSRPRSAPIERSDLPVPRLPEVAANEPPNPSEAADLLPAPSPERREEPPKSIASMAPSRTDAGDLPPRSRPNRPAPGIEERRPTSGLAPLTIARAAPSRLPAIPPSRPLPDVPEVYQPRLAPDRAVRALRAGASEASEMAVERALEWLAGHQDADGRWNGGTKKYSNENVVEGESNFTRHCPPGDACSGECYYWEADSAMTGLALLAFLGNGHTHVQDGRYAATVRRGLQYLLSIQKPDGDLRGESLAVGLYCHAMASLAMCEAYALSGDERLRGPVERAVTFLVKSRAADGFSWRYTPGAPSGDTSILGWVVLVFKSAQEVGIKVPQAARVGAMGWLNKVAEGPDKGLAVYRPNEGPYGGANQYEPGRNMTPTMTAEAWACRQLLGMGGPGPSSDEAARYLLKNAPDRDGYNLYYWYYGTLAMFQHGGDSWDRWNGRVRDELVSLQKTSGHEAGSWSPQDSKGRYDARGGRIYCTALAALTLEVYYRYQRNLKPAPNLAPSPDPTIRRAGAGR